MGGRLRTVLWPSVASLHAGVAARADELKKLEWLCRYVIRPAVAEKGLSLAPNENVRYQLKTPYRDGTTDVIFESLDFIARLAALAPKPRVNPTCYHGVFAPNSKHRALVSSRRLNVRFEVTGTLFPYAIFSLQCVVCCRYPGHWLAAARQPGSRGRVKTLHASNGKDLTQTWHLNWLAPPVPAENTLTS